MTEYQTLVTVVPGITKLLTSEDFRTPRIGSAEIISVSTDMMGSMTTYTKAQLDNHACSITVSSPSAGIGAFNYRITYGNNQISECAMLMLRIPMFTNLEPDVANELNEGSQYPMEVRQNLTVTEIPTGGTLLYNDSPVSVGDTIRLDSNLTFAPDDYMNEHTEFDQNINPIPRRLGVTVTYHGSTYDIAGQTFTVPIYPQTHRSSVINFSKYYYDERYYSLNVNGMMPYSGMFIIIDALPSNAGTLYQMQGSYRYALSVGDLALGSLLWKSSLPPTADYSQNLEYHYEDRIVNGVLKYPAGVGQQVFQVTVLAPTMYTHTFSIPECQSDGTAWPYGTEIGALDYAAAPPVTATIETSGSPFAVSGDVLIVDNGSRLDYETKPTWIVKARVTDQYGQYREANQTINITDVNEPPTISDLKVQYQVKENTDIGTVIGTFYVYDDTPSQATATISGPLTGSELGDEGYDLSDIFYIDRTTYNSSRATMAIKVKNKDLLNFEELYKVASGNASYTATITVGNSAASVTATTNITIKDVYEGPIVMEDQTFNFPDRTSQDTIQPAGTIVGQVIASDPDIYNPTFSRLTYLITAQDGNVFGINLDSGDIYIVDGSGLYVGQSYEITVMATDGHFTKSATMTINITRGGRILTWNGKLIQPLDRTGSILRV